MYAVLLCGVIDCLYGESPREYLDSAVLRWERHGMAYSQRKVISYVRGLIVPIVYRRYGDDPVDKPTYVVAQLTFTQIIEMKLRLFEDLNTENNVVPWQDLAEWSMED